MIYLVFPVAMDRADHRVLPSDIPAALQYFLGKTGMSPDHICAGPGIKENLEGALPEGISLELHSGVLSWEIWLGAENYKPAPVVTLISTSEGNLNNPSVNDKMSQLFPAARTMIQRGRPRVSGPYMSRTTRWRRQKEAFASNKLLL